MTVRPQPPLTRLRAAGLAGPDGPTDGQLLGRYVDDRDEAALAALVRRLGPAVLGVCRRTIGDAHLAEDAFQATFLVLVRRAGVVRPREQVGAWLYGVADRVARRARAVHARRLAREEPMSADPPARGGADRLDDLLPVLDEELARLPGHYRAAVLLCDLEGRTRKDAARRLGIPDGTLSNRLAAARRVLARRLARRGVTAGVGVPLAASGAPRVSAALVDATVRTAAAPGPGPAAFAEGEIKVMLLAKLKGLTAAAAVGVVGLAVVAAGAVPPAAGQDTPAAKPVARAAAPPAPVVLDNDGRFDDLAFSPDGKWVAAQTRVDDGDDPFKRTYPIKVWDARTGKPVRTLFDGKHVAGVAVSPDGKRVATTLSVCDQAKLGDGDVRDAFTGKVLVWDVATGKEAATLEGWDVHCPYHVAFSPDGKYLAAGGGLLEANSEPAGGDVTVWDLATGAVL